MTGHNQPDLLIVRIYRGLLACFPAAYRQEYGEELVYAVRMAAGEARGQGIVPAMLLAWRELRDLPLAAVRAHFRERAAEMRTQSSGSYSGAKTSFRLSLANILITLLMIVILYTGFVAITFRSLPLPAQLGLTILLFAIPTVLSIASLVIGLRSVLRSNKTGEKVSWMAVIGTLLGGMGTLNLAFIFLGIIMESYAS